MAHKHHHHRTGEVTLHMARPPNVVQFQVVMMLRRGQNPHPHPQDQKMPGDFWTAFKFCCLKR